MKHTPLKFEELNDEQKIGMTLMGAGGSPGFSQFAYALDKIKKHALGTVWVISDQYDAPDFYREHIKQISGKCFFLKLTWDGRCVTAPCFVIDAFNHRNSAKALPPAIRVKGS